ncbi:T9SS type A sorting domain-containing protein [Flammeovirga aprica]|uniref:T9SS type A sorting domain-containing protein n=1 Tax=Flammeovirga aprica JL-4 TaxID=694437 RepID=A0A7X9XD87_9BACT|nr:T9SS type A sorting domain-containing protein [Flammeovirga aprica]NME72538.1 T9SS type A sorting domain-containing protein [Flammeovirga aprica JL-4]
MKIKFLFIIALLYSFNSKAQLKELTLYSDDDVTMTVSNSYGTMPLEQKCVPGKKGYIQTPEGGNISWNFKVNGQTFGVTKVTYTFTDSDGTIEEVEEEFTPLVSISNPFTFHAKQGRFNEQFEVKIKMEWEKYEGVGVKYGATSFSFYVAPAWSVYKLYKANHITIEELKKTYFFQFNKSYLNLYTNSFTSHPCAPLSEDYIIENITEKGHLYQNEETGRYTGIDDQVNVLSFNYKNHGVYINKIPTKYYEYTLRSRTIHINVELDVYYPYLDTREKMHATIYFVLPPPPSISGAGKITEEATTYYLGNLNGYELKSWEVSSEIKVISENSNSITVKGINYTNKGFIKANFKSGNSSVKEIKVWPALDDLKLSDLIYSRNMLFCNQKFLVQVINHTGQRVEWIAIQGSLPTNGQSTHSSLIDGKHSNYITSKVTRENDYVEVLVRVVRKNGTKTPYVSFRVSASCPGGGGDGDGFIPRFSSLRTKEIDGITDFGYKIFPNPVKDNLNIEANSTFMGNIDSITIYDINGNIIDNYEFVQYESNSYRINTGKYKPGLYILNIIKSDGSVDIEKIIVE